MTQAKPRNMYLSYRSYPASWGRGASSWKKQLHISHHLHSCCPNKSYGEMQDVPTVLNPLSISNLATVPCVYMDMYMQMDAHYDLPNSGYE